MSEHLFLYLSSLLTYGSAFALAAVFFAKAQQCTRLAKKTSAHAYLVLGAFVLCLLSAMRAENVGTDTKTYGVSVFYGALRHDSLLAYLAEFSYVEDIYKVIAYPIAKITSSLGAYLFVIAALTVWPICLAAKRFSNRIPIQKVLMAFMLLYYCMSLNIMRQSIAAAFFLLAITYYLDKKKFGAVLCGILSLMFHRSMVFGLILVLCIRILIKIKNKTRRYALTLFLCVALSYIAMNWQSIASWAIYETNILPSKYGYYLSIFSGESIAASRQHYFNKSGFGRMDFAFRTALCIVPLLMGRAKKTSAFLFLRNATILGYVCYLFMFFALNTAYGYRMVMYLDYLNILYIPCYMSHGKTRIGISTWRNIFLWGMIFAYFVVIYFLTGAHEAVPYQFAMSM